jgi:hypothetical protein
MMTVGFRRERGAVAGETARERAERLDAEASRLAVAKADVAGGRYIADGDLDGWLEDWERGKLVSLPETPTSSGGR